MPHFAKFFPLLAALPLSLWSTASHADSLSIYMNGSGTVVAHESIGLNLSSSSFCLFTCKSLNATISGDAIIRSGDQEIRTGRPALIQAETERLRAQAAAGALAASRQSTTKNSDLLPNHPPQKPEMIPIYEREIVTSALYELIPGSGVYIASLHSFQELSRESVEESFARKGLKLGNYSAYIFMKAGRRHDVLLFVPNIQTPANLFTRLNSADFRMKKLPEMAEALNGRDYFYSYQRGLGTPGGETTRQESYGNILRYDSTYAYLENSASNLSSPGSSGALVHTLPSNSDLARDFSSQWRIAGIIECNQPDYYESKVRVHGGVRVITMDTLRNSNVYSVNINQILAERREVDRSGKCPPLDRRGAGGPRSRD